MPPLDIAQHEHMTYIYHQLREHNIPVPKEWDIQWVTQEGGHEHPVYIAHTPTLDIMASQKKTNSWELYLTQVGSRLSNQNDLTDTSEPCDENGIHLVGHKYTMEFERHYQNGKLHNIDGPACIYRKETTSIHHHFHQGERHRNNGPAIYSTPHNSDNPSEEDYSPSYMIHGVTIPINNRILTAIDTTDQNLLARMTRYKNPAVAYYAAHNPACPELAKTEWILARSTDFPHNP